MQNLDQIRAAAALKLLPEGKPHHFDRSDVASIPAMILTNGLLAAAAFCCEKDKKPREGMKAAFDGIATHLNQRGIISSNSLIEELSQQDSLTLQRATAEALAFLSYLKRFALPKKKDANS